MISKVHALRLRVSARPKPAEMAKTIKKRKQASVASI